MFRSQRQSVERVGSARVPTLDALTLHAPGKKSSKPKLLMHGPLAGNDSHFQILVLAFQHLPGEPVAGAICIAPDTTKPLFNAQSRRAAKVIDKMQQVLCGSGAGFVL